MRFFRWLKDKLKHKLEHLRWSSIKKTFRQHGLALVIIIVGWEIIEDIIFPIIFAFLGANVHPAFYSGIPASLILCFHWLAVPILWGIWIRISGNKDAEKKDFDECCDSH